MHSLGIFLLLFVLLPVSRSLDYSDLEVVGVSCPERDSCARIRRGGHPEDRNCECDADCWSYGDCCVDATYRRRPRPSSGTVLERKDDVVCLNYGRDNDTGVYVVARCSSGWDGPRQIREKCEGTLDWSDPVSAAPVRNVAQSVTYKNLFCAKCNDAHDAESLQAFHIRLACDGGPAPPADLADRLFYDEKRAAWGFDRSDGRGNWTFSPCVVSFEIPDSMKSLRLCRANMVSECAPDWTVRKTRLRCGRYTAVVLDESGRAYRNPHCALCNHQKPDRLTCGPSLLARQRPASYELLLDPNRGDRLDTGVAARSRMRQCPPLHIYDPFFERCRRLVCALPNHRLVGGRCVAETDPQKSDR